MSYIREMDNNDAITRLTRPLGDAVRAARKRLGLTQVDVAQRAGINRQKLIQVEQGKPGVALAAYVAAMQAVDLAPSTTAAEVQIDDYPQLKRLTWNRPGATTLTERDALALYERYWSLVDAEQMTPQEAALVRRLADQYGHGLLHV